MREILAYVVVVWMFSTPLCAMEETSSLTQENLAPCAIQLSSIEFSCVTLSRLIASTDSDLTPHSKSSLETIFGLLVTKEKVDLSCALLMLRTRFVEVAQTNEELTSAASLCDILQQDKTGALQLSAYENCIIQLNKDVPMFWANIELRKDTGSQHTHVYTLSLLTKPIEEAITILTKRTELKTQLAKTLAELVNIKSAEYVTV